MLLYETKAVRLRSRTALSDDIKQGLANHFRGRGLGAAAYSLCLYSISRLESVSHLASLRQNYKVPKFRLYSEGDCVVPKQFCSLTESEWVFGCSIWGDYHRPVYEVADLGETVCNYYMPDDNILKTLVSTPLPLSEYRVLELSTLLRRSNLPAGSKISRQDKTFYYTIYGQTLLSWRV
jgi:hypothetical protein